MVIGIRRMGVRKYGLGLKRSMRETLSDIFYKMYYYNVILSGGALIAGQIRVQVDAERDARSFWWGGWVVGFARLSHPNYKPTMGGKRIETRDGRAGGRG